jgi:hypothetical protein
MPLQVYMSGDAGSQDLCERLYRARVSYVRRDIRVHMRHDASANIKELLKRQFTTVPQVFTEGGMHLGDYAATVAWMRGRPDTMAIEPPDAA